MTRRKHSAPPPDAPRLPRPDARRTLGWRFDDWAVI